MTAPEAGSGYRRDVDGLRAIAILVVVLFHAGVPGFAGGFAGVDVFFVISGFLITGLLVDEAERDGGIDLRAFYARRIRRLMPACLLVLAVTLVLGWLYLTPVGGGQQSLAKSAIAALLFNANHYFAFTTGGYFDGPAEFQPLLHMWSLSVEEQFYVVWPLLLMAIAAYARRGQGRGLRGSATLVLGAIWVTSLAASWVWTQRAPVVAFYVMPTRAFELATGGLLAIHIARMPRGLPVAGSLLSVAGIAAVAWFTVGYDGAMAFPGVAALVPVLGTAAIILGNHLAPAGLSARLLSSRPMVLTGLVSYSWYLWHWPLLAIVRAQSVQARDPARDLAIVVVAFVLAWLTYRFVENPVRRSRQIAARGPNRVIVAGVAASALFAVAFAAFGYVAKNGPFDDRTAELMSAAADMAPLRKRCHIDNDKPWDGRFPPATCWQGKAEGRPVLVIWGDSHASQWTAISDAALARDWSVIPRTMSACAPFYGSLDTTTDGADDCRRFNRAVLDEIVAMGRERTVVVLVAARWIRLGTEPGDPGAAAGAGSGNLHGNARYRAGLANADEVLGRLSAAGVGTVVLLPTPEMPQVAPACLARHDPHICGRSLADYRRDRTAAVDQLGGTTQTDGPIIVFDPTPLFCAAGDCPAELAGVVLFTDDNHPTVTAVRRAASPLLAAIESARRTAVQ